MSLIRDLLALVGIGIFLAGLYQWNVPAAYVAGGLILSVSAAAWSWASRKEPR